jgi:hypothetical protein
MHLVPHAAGKVQTRHDLGLREVHRGKWQLDVVQDCSSLVYMYLFMSFLHPIPFTLIHPKKGDESERAA